MAVYAAYLPLNCSVVLGGVNINPQSDALNHGIDVLVAIPGWLL